MLTKLLSASALVVLFAVLAAPQARCEEKAKDDATVIKEQAASYPMDTCVACGMKLGEKPVDCVANGRLIRVCSDKCKDAVKKDAAALIKKIDEAAAKKKEVKKG